VATAARIGGRADAGLLIGCVVLSLIAVALKDEDREPIASALRRSIVAPLVRLQRGAERWRTAWVMSDQRQLVADSVAVRGINTQALRVENEQLRKIIGLGSRLEWGFIPAEAVHSAAPTEEVVTNMTLTAGSLAGVQRFNPVVSAEGLVGVVQTADPTMSVAILYTSTDFRASAMTADGSAFGIVYPHTGRGTSAYLLELRGVPTRMQLRPGMQIFTSGLGGTFPRGIAIGTVIDSLKTAEVWTRTYLLRPAVTPSRVTTVLILTAQRVTQGTGNVWGAAVSLDSATRRIGAPNDSIARRAAIIEAQARQAALDSVKRATIDSVRRSLGYGAAPLTPADSAASAAHTVTPAMPATPRPVVPRRDSLRPDTARKIPP
jgi:rod shape-determining protein MreC